MEEQGKEVSVTEVLDQMIAYHAHRIATVAPNPSKYIPWTAVYQEYLKQEGRAILRLKEMKRLAEEKVNGTKNT
jgi:hypothetical protein